MMVKVTSKENVRKLNTHIRACVRDAIDDGYITLDLTHKVELNATNNCAVSWIKKAHKAVWEQFFS